MVGWCALIGVQTPSEGPSLASVMPPTGTLNFPGGTARAIRGSCRAMSASTAARPAPIRSRPRLRRLGCAAPEQVANGVWLLRGGLTRTMNVYLLEEPDGSRVTVYD